jgi:ATP-dependent RNA helicase DDX23/PRP28
MQAIPIGMMHKDLMAIAPTGEGKTLAYLLPIIQFLLPLERMNMNNFDEGPYALVLVPTRELAEQI